MPPGMHRDEREEGLLTQEAPVDSVVARPPISRDQKVALAANSIFNNSWALVAGLVAFIVTPVMLGRLGADLFGVWTTMLAFVSVAALLDCGVGVVVTRFVASGDQDERAQAVASAALSFYLLLGVLGGLAIALLGPFAIAALGVRLGVSGGRIIFGAVGIAFLGEQLTACASAVFTGQQRFRVVASLSVLGSLVKGAGLLYLTLRGVLLPGLLAWYAAVALALGALALGISAMTGPGMAFRHLRPGWRLLFQERRYALMTRADSLIGTAIFQGPLLLIAALNGPVAVAEFRIGQRLPSEVSGIAWRSSEVFFPAASEYSLKREHDRLQDVLLLSTRWMAVLALPLMTSFVLLAPELLRAWVGVVPVGAEAVLRIIAVGAALGAMGYGAENMLVAEGRARHALAVSTTVAVLILGLGGWMLHLWGVLGLSAATVIAWGFSMLAYLTLECRAHKLSLWRLGRSATRGLVIPLAAEICAVLLARNLVPQDRWLSAIVPLGAALSVYLVVLYLTSPDERGLIKTGLRWLRDRSRLVREPATMPVAVTSVDEVFHRNSDI